MLIVRMLNNGGELDRQLVEAPPCDEGQMALEAMIQMIRDCGELHAGDRFEVIEE